MATPFVPKQALNFHGALLQELQGNVSDTIAQSLLRELPTLTSTSVVHDNGCSYGAVTLAILALDPPPVGAQVYATDVNPMFQAQLKAELAKISSPPVKVEVDTMDACNLSFPDAAFDLSITSFVFAGLADDVAAAKHILRTLKPGGTGVIGVWKSMPWHVALENAHIKTRGTDEPMAPFLSKSWYGKERIEQVTTEAGWEDVQYIDKAAWLNLGTDLERWARIAWTFLATPVGGWTQRDEDRWDEAISSISHELAQSDMHKFEDGIHKIRMVADIAVVRKK
ncbi:S-adenosyl-L-methionine-dependent methyltransferase [Periconia macrospinosa]|uniref:S-adenosyl-L-methionine-dependent methyltransferase n=1 Tax=Periconia macrospinosa TaxID=97972 RepID=A0A2V1D593_9PLEO|nr:S-adenosyl-L-methionine-dependent methyltransferase [Periconia macrospinosa]